MSHYRPTASQRRAETRIRKSVGVAGSYGVPRWLELVDDVALLTVDLDDGTVLVAEVIDRLGRVLSPAAAERAIGQTRELALRQADELVDAVVSRLELEHHRGERVNVAATHSRTGIARNTLYTRLKLRDVDVSPRARASR